MRKARDIPEALNTDERFWAAIGERLDVIIDLLTPKTEVKVVTSEITTEVNIEEVKEEIVKPKKKRTTKK